MADTEKILQAIQSQRWFFFRNNDKILFDRDTALIWANMKYFPYCKAGGMHYSCNNSYSEVKNLISEKNSSKFGGFSDWRIPTHHELWKMILSKSFPFHSEPHWQIKGFFSYCVTYGSGLSGKNLGEKGASSDISTFYDVAVIPCSSALVSRGYSATPQEIIDIFTKNNLIPIFRDESINEPYQKIFTGKTVQKNLTVKFDYKPLLAKFNLADLGRSPIKYFDAVLSVTDEFLDALQEFESAQAETIAESLKIALKLNAKYVDNPNLTAEENSLLAERQKFLSQRLELNTDAPKLKILSVKAQAERFFERLDAINEGNNSIRQLAELQAESRADFEFLAENLARIITEAQKKVEFFTAHKNLVTRIINSHSTWSDNYKSFKTSLREELAANCRADGVDEEIFAAWYDDWQKKRFAIEQRFLPLVEFALKDRLNDSFGRVLEILQSYRCEVDKFYLHERKNIYQKFAFQSGGELQEKFETESELYKLSEKFQRDLQTIIFSLDDTEERIFILRWSEPLLNISIDEISNFVRDKELDAISEEVLTQFAELKRQNFATYIADSKSYSDAVQKREKEFNALIFRMRKDLRKN